MNSNLEVIYLKQLPKFKSVKLKVKKPVLQNALLQEASEEWEQCERKMKDARNWMEKAKQTLESPQNKKKSLRDQHAIREKMLSDIAIQKTKITISVEKLEVHFRSGIGGDNRVRNTADDLIAELNALHNTVKEQTSSLEACLAQIDQYQQVSEKNEPSSLLVCFGITSYSLFLLYIASRTKDRIIFVSGNSTIETMHRAGGATAENGAQPDLHGERPGKSFPRATGRHPFFISLHKR